MNRIIFFTSLIMLSSCASVSYMSDSLSDVDLPEFESYSTIDNCDESVNPIMVLRVKNAIDINMKRERKVRSKNPDVLVQYFIKNETKSYQSNCRVDYDRWVGGEECRDKVITYEEGSIVVDIVNTNNNTIVWHGVIKGPSFNYIKDPDTKINEMVSNLMSLFFENKQIQNASD